MKLRSTVLALTVAVLLSGMGPSLAAGTKSAASQPAASASAAKAPPKATSKTASAATAQAPASSKLVDINTATSKELKKLPGIDDAKAAKIIAGRLYGSKAQLVSRNVIDAAEYENLKKLIVAKQPYKDAASNAALYTDKK
jgi:DNA uptake protein ComE-like DNA-binding protein